MQKVNSNPNIKELKDKIISLDNNNPNSVEKGSNGNPRAEYLLRKAAAKEKKLEFHKLGIIREKILETIEYIKKNPHIIDAPAKQGFAGDELRKNKLTEAYRWTILNPEDSIKEANERLAKASKILDDLCSKNVEETKEYVEKIVKKCDVIYWAVLTVIAIVAIATVLGIGIAISQNSRNRW